MAVRASDPTQARTLRHRAAMLEARLVVPAWRDIAAGLPRLRGAQAAP